MSAIYVHHVDIINPYRMILWKFVSSDIVLLLLDHGNRDTSFMLQQYWGLQRSSKNEAW